MGTAARVSFAVGALVWGRPTRALLGLAVTGALAGCGGTRGLILGEVPSADASAIVVVGPDAATVDAGCATCPLPVVLSGGTPTPQQGGTTATGYTDTCPGNQAVIGYQGFLTSPSSAGLLLVGGIQAVCGTLASSGSPPSGITTSAGATLPIRGTSRVAPWTQMCPADQIVVGFSGRSGAALDQVAFTCAPWSAANGGSGATLSMGAPVTLAAAGGDGGGPFQDSCPAGELARGSNLRAGEWVDAFGLVCGTPTLASDAGP